jgi:hypothetical protein
LPGLSLYRLNIKNFAFLGLNLKISISENTEPASRFKLGPERNTAFAIKYENIQIKIHYH